MFIEAEACTCWNNREQFGTISPKQVSTGARGRTAPAATSGLPSTSGLAKQRRLSQKHTELQGQVSKTPALCHCWKTNCALGNESVLCALVRASPSPGAHPASGGGVPCPLCCPWWDLMVSSPFFYLSLTSRSCPRDAVLEEFLGAPSPTSSLGLQERSAMGLPRSWGSDPAVLPLCHGSVTGCHIHPRSHLHPGALPIPPFPTTSPRARCPWLWERTKAAPVQTSLYFCPGGCSVWALPTASRHVVPKKTQDNIKGMSAKCCFNIQICANTFRGIGPNPGGLSSQSPQKELLRGSSAIQRCPWNWECFNPCSQQVPAQVSQCRHKHPLRAVLSPALPPCPAAAAKPPNSTSNLSAGHLHGPEGSLHKQRAAGFLIDRSGAKRNLIPNLIYKPCAEAL